MPTCHPYFVNYSIYLSCCYSTVQDKSYSFPLAYSLWNTVHCGRERVVGGAGGNRSLCLYPGGREQFLDSSPFFFLFHWNPSPWDR